METTKMTIHRALSELKLIDARITKQISELQPVAINQKERKINGFVSPNDFKEIAISGYQSIKDLIDRKIKIKSSIVESNSKTQVSVGGKQLTVADAISFKKIIDLKKKLSAHLVANLYQKTALLNQQNEAVNKNADNILQASVGGDMSKASKDVVDNITKPYLENNIFSLVDPLNIEQEIKTLNKEIGDFEVEVDAVLSESNAITFIEI